jgi:hypothetical protein
MQRFQRIEDLIGSTVPRMTMPEHLGEAPEWKVSSGKKKFNSKKKPFRKKSTNKPSHQQTKD